MSRLKSSFWENPTEPDVDASVYENDEAEEEWEQEVVSSLESLATILVEDG
jgi:nuclear pore complex protein Nup107